MTALRTSRTPARLALATTAAVLAGTLSSGIATAAPAPSRTTVEHGTSHTHYFGDDACGDRSNWTTYTATVSQERFAELDDGSWSYRYVGVVTYVSTYDDTSLGTLEGRLTEVGSFRLTPGGTFRATETYHDFYGDIRIWVRLNVAWVGGQPTVERTFERIDGCP